MKMIKGIFIGVSIETIIILAYAICRVSGKCSNLEEAQYNSENV